MEHLQQTNRLPFVSIITINFNQADVICELLDSLKKCTYPEFEVIVVDNNSAGNDAGLIQHKHPQAKIIMSPKNLGFAGGNNLGMQNASGTYFLFLNNDTEVEPGFLEPLVELLQQNPSVGVVSPKIRYYFSKETLQYAGYTHLSPITLRNKALGYHEKDTGQYNMAKLTPYAHGAAMMAKKSVVNEAGPMPEVYFLYYEELDWSNRIKEKGYTIMYQPLSLIFHKESLTTGKNSPLKAYFMVRNRMIFAMRNNKGMFILLSIIYQLIVLFTQLLKNMLSLQFTYARAQLSGVISFIRYVADVKIKMRTKYKPAILKP